MPKMSSFEQLSMTIQPTSRESYEQIKPELGTRQMEIYEYLKHFGPANNTMIAASLKLPINSITPRTFELRDKCLVGVSHIDRCPKTGRKSIWWKYLKNKQTLLENANKEI